jgi:hypothetical protein
MGLFAAEKCALTCDLLAPAVFFLIVWCNVYYEWNSSMLGVTLNCSLVWGPGPWTVFAPGGRIKVLY